jgi:hypothetical protein
MDPFTIALATFGIQKLRGKSTKRSLRDAAIAGGIGQVAGMAGFGSTMGPNMGSFAPTAFGNTGNFIGRQAAIEAGTGEIAKQTLGSQVSQAGGGIYDLGKNLIGQPDKYNKAGTEILTEGSGFRGLSTGAQLGLGLGATTLLAGEDEPTEMPEGTKPEDYAEAKKKADEQLENILNTYDYEADAAGVNQTQSPYNYTDNSLYTFSKGGIAEIKKFNKGGINYLPSMTDHDKNDETNYVRAMGYVEDGSGNGDKDEDTMLAQLADGEFVSRADAILGAGIMEGGDPKSYKDMRKKGAAFFYGQQAKFKRIFDLLDASRKKTN